MKTFVMTFRFRAPDREKAERICFEASLPITRYDEEGWEIVHPTEPDEKPGSWGRTIPG